MTHLINRIKYVLRRRYPAYFINSWKQNLLMFVLTAYLINVFRLSLRTNIMYLIQMLIAPSTGFYPLVTYMEVFLWLILPWRPIRRNVWNRVFYPLINYVNYLIYGGIIRWLKQLFVKTTLHVKEVPKKKRQRKKTYNEYGLEEPTEYTVRLDRKGELVKYDKNGNIIE